ncbi:MAG: class I SAM-dependent methyltransferase, partial [Thermoleophilaceae bacterium]
MTDQPAPLLLHSLSTFRELILCCLEIVQARRIVEIGSETGALTIELSDWAAERQAVVVSVDPEPAHSVVKRAAETPALELVAGVSPEALEGIQPADVYIIDGDHNHYSVSRELRHVFADPERFPLAILHDVG